MNAQKQIDAFIVDDEPIAIRIIRRMLEGDTEIRVTGEYRDPGEACKAIREQKPDLVFLDVQMPEINGFELLGNLEQIPYVIFVTAYDQYALKAFEVNALDYLLKPFHKERFDLAIRRAKEQIRLQKEGRFGRSIAAAVEQYRAGQAEASGTGVPGRYMQRLSVRSGGRIYFLPVNEIEWIEAAENYVMIHAAGQTHMVRAKIAALEGQLDPEVFVRAHRSAIVNVKFVREVQFTRYGDSVALLQNGQRVRISRSRRSALLGSGATGAR